MFYQKQWYIHQIVHRVRTSCNLSAPLCIPSMMYHSPVDCCGKFTAWIVFLQGIFDSTRVKTEVNSMIEDLQLVDKKKVQSKNLSGGMKRKLRYVNYTSTMWWCYIMCASHELKCGHCSDWWVWDCYTGWANIRNGSVCQAGHLGPPR